MVRYLCTVDVTGAVTESDEAIREAALSATQVISCQTRRAISLNLHLIASRLYSLAAPNTTQLSGPIFLCVLLNCFLPKL